MRRTLLSLLATSWLLLGAVSASAQSTVKIPVGAVCFGDCRTAAGNHSLDLYGIVDPTAGAGVPAPLGSTYRWVGTSGGTYWLKTGSGDTAWTRTLTYGTLTSGLLKVAVSSGLATPSTATAGTDYVSPSSTEALTNKTLNVESTGNIVTVVERLSLRTGTCPNSGTGAYEDGWDWHGPGADAYTNGCVVGSNVTYGRLEASEAGGAWFENHLWLPADWTGTIDVKLAWTTTATTGNVKWQFQTACSAAGETLDPSWNSANTVTTAANASASRLIVSTLTSVTTTGCSAGEIMFFRVLRDPTDGSDTLSASAFLVSVELAYRRAQ